MVRIRKTACAVLALVALALALGTPAHASTGLVLSCEVVGGIYFEPYEWEYPGLLPDYSPPAGTYYLNEFEAPCALTRDGAVVDAVTLDIMSQGWYVPSLAELWWAPCRTAGGALSDENPFVYATSLTGNAENEALIESTSFGYHLGSWAGLGLLSWDNPDLEPQPVAGVFELYPETDVQSCLSDWVFAGTFTAVIQPPV